MNNSLPTYPNTRPLTLGDKELVESFVNKYPPYSDFNFLSLWSYNTENDLQISELSGTFIIRLRDYMSNDPVCSFIGTADIPRICGMVFAELKNNGSPLLIKYVPEVTARILEDYSEFSVKEDRDSFDYVYSLETLTNLTGGSMHKLRNYINRFSNLYPDIQAKTLNLSDVAIQDEVLSVFDEWKKEKGQGEEAKHERVAVKRTLQCHDSVDNIIALGLYDAEKMVAFLFVDYRSDGYSQGHFAKALTSRYHGITSFLYHSMAVLLYEKGCRYINLEQDLGIDGLRKAKKQMNPIYFLKKYSITPGK